jgi:hypothetical protein
MASTLVALKAQLLAPATPEAAAVAEAEVDRQVRQWESISVTPSGASASRMALTMAGGIPTDPTSAQPLARSGLLVLKVGHISASKPGRSDARARAQSYSDPLSGCPGGIMHMMLQQRLVDALGQATMELPVHDHRVDDGVDIVRGNHLD